MSEAVTSGSAESVAEHPAERLAEHPAPQPGPRRSRPRYEGDPSLAKVMRRPKWIGALLLALLVAGVFAWLGQWQLGHAITLENEHAVDAEAVRPISEATEPGGTVTDQVAGTVLSASGSFVAGDFDVVEQRTNGGALGAWTIGHLVVPGESGAPDGHLAVALGWAPDRASAERALAAVEDRLADVQVDLEGRYMPSDGPVRPEAGADPRRLLSMAPAQLVNLWQPFEGRAYAGFLVLHPSDAGAGVDAGEGEFNKLGLADLGLDPIDSVPPLPVETINWLNLFYAAEWVVFAGFAVFFWYRLARDDWERIHELRLLTESEDDDAAGPAGSQAAGRDDAGAARANAAEE